MSMQEVWACEWKELNPRRLTLFFLTVSMGVRQLWYLLSISLFWREYKFREGIVLVFIMKILANLETFLIINDKCIYVFWFYINLSSYHKNDKISRLWEIKYISKYIKNEWIFRILVMIRILFSFYFVCYYYY